MTPYLYQLYAAWSGNMTPSEFATYIILPAIAVWAVVGTLRERRKK